VTFSRPGAPDDTFSVQVTAVVESGKQRLFLPVILRQAR
jgi:hypothetical protein